MAAAAATLGAAGPQAWRCAVRHSVELLATCFSSCICRPLRPRTWPPGRPLPAPGVMPRSEVPAAYTRQASWSVPALPRCSKRLEWLQACRSCHVNPALFVNVSSRHILSHTLSSLAAAVTAQQCRAAICGGRHCPAAASASIRGARGCVHLRPGADRAPSRTRATPLP